MFSKLVFTLYTIISLVHTAAPATVDLNEFELSIIHTNDFHARFEEINSNRLTCTKKDVDCIGGFSRLYATIHKLKVEYPDSIVLDGGDNFQGTLWYTMYKWNAVQYFLNKIPFDVHTLGNHEFDDKLEGVIPLIQNLKAPMVVTNIDDSEEPEFQNLCNRSIIINRFGRKIGIVGVMFKTTNEISSTGKLKFLDESESVNKEAKRLVAEDNVDTIIVLSHSGYTIEKLIAQNAAPKIGLIVGAHSHSLLFTGKPPKGYTAEGPYPTVINHSDGRKILVVQASAYTQFLGHIFVKYDKNGNVVSWNGVPIYLDNNIAQDPKINEDIAEWKKSIEEIGSTVLGRTSVYLEGRTCRTTECSLGNLLADAMIFAHLDTKDESAWCNAAIALISPGGIRNPLQIGDITKSHFEDALPFEDTYDIAELQGKHIMAALEHSAKPFGTKNRESRLNLLQVSGIHVIYNVTNAPGSRVQSLKVRCRECPIPKYEAIKMDKYYRVVINSFLVFGGDGFKEYISDNIINHSVGESDREVLRRYFIQHNPIIQSAENRIHIVN